MRKLLNLFIEHTIALVDVGDISLILVVPFPRELALLVNTVTRPFSTLNYEML